MEEQKFRSSIRRVNESRKHKITGSLGVYDAYKWYRKNKPKEKKYILTESQYFTIIRKINEALREELILTGDLTLPCRLGRLEIRKYPAIITNDGKKIKTNLPIDWDTTLKLWFEDEECRRDKTLVRSNVPEIFRVYYNKSKANYENKSFYQFSTNRELKRLLKDTIKNDINFDAFVNHI
jgi:hypothetical protein